MAKATTPLGDASTPWLRERLTAIGRQLRNAETEGERRALRNEREVLHEELKFRPPSSRQLGPRDLEELARIAGIAPSARSRADAAFLDSRLEDLVAAARWGMQLEGDLSQAMKASSHRDLPVSLSAQVYRILGRHHVEPSDEEVSPASPDQVPGF